MAFRTLEIANPAELHVKSGQLQVSQETGEVHIPLDDISVITCIGSGIRFSSMAATKLAECGITIQCLNERYQPSAMIVPCEYNSRQSMVIYKQVSLEDSKVSEIWKTIVQSKIENQSRVLSILGLPGAEKVASYSMEVETGDFTHREGVAAKEYFENFCPGLNRRTDTPMNSCLNYGYAILRNSIIRSGLATGFLMSWGLFHHNQYNPFNLADDLIEPWRPAVDLVAYHVVGENIKLTKDQRKSLSNVLYNACVIDNKKIPIISGIDYMINSLKNYISEGSESNGCEIATPTVIPIEKMDLITE